MYDKCISYGNQGNDRAIVVRYRTEQLNLEKKRIAQMLFDQQDYCWLKAYIAWDISNHIQPNSVVNKYCDFSVRKLYRNYFCDKAEFFVQTYWYVTAKLFWSLDIGNSHSLWSWHRKVYYGLNIIDAPTKQPTLNMYSKRFLLGYSKLRIEPENRWFYFECFFSDKDFFERST